MVLLTLNLNEDKLMKAMFYMGLGALAYATWLGNIEWGWLFAAAVDTVASDIIPAVVMAADVIGGLF